MSAEVRVPGSRGRTQVELIEVRGLAGERRPPLHARGATRQASPVAQPSPIASVVGTFSPAQQRPRRHACMHALHGHRGGARSPRWGFVSWLLRRLRSREARIRIHVRRSAALSRCVRAAAAVASVSNGVATIRNVLTAISYALAATSCALAAISYVLITRCLSTRHLRFRARADGHGLECRAQAQSAGRLQRLLLQQLLDA